MTARMSAEGQMAVAHALSTGCSAADAAKAYGVTVRTVQRGLALAGKSRPVGRPAKT